MQRVLKEQHEKGDILAQERRLLIDLDRIRQHTREALRILGAYKRNSLIEEISTNGQPTSTSPFVLGAGHCPDHFARAIYIQLGSVFVKTPRREAIAYLQQKQRYYDRTTEETRKHVQNLSLELATEEDLDEPALTVKEREQRSERQSQLNSLKASQRLNSV